ncbi:unnamed protein product [Cuscuta europaea]|uniref:RNA helicase n=1 Tax=Cuscuta europaea TaxID=41803 RepID=A0A9P0Z851_CUSEU|nr:unnamed protein product [Cuscuta europaea]
MAATATANSAGPRYAPEDPTLPKPWRGLVDGKTGYLYFWNPETNVTQYARPEGASPADKSSSELASPSIQKPSQEKQPEDGDKYGGGNNGSNDKSTSELLSSSVQKSSQEKQAEDGDRYGRDSNESSQFSAGESVQAVGSSFNQSCDASNLSESGCEPSATKAYSAVSVANDPSPESYRRQHDISVSGVNVPPPFTSFSVTGFPSELLREMQKAGFSAPTPIQAQSWPIAMQGRDIVAIAKTGSGKTLGYLVPGFMHLKGRRNNPKMGPTVLVLSPTRELATQIQDEAVKFGASSRFACTCLYGGAPKGPQLRELDKGVDIVVATPGRLNDILEMRRVNLQQISYLVLDEADRMLDMGFEPQIRKIVKEVPSKRQTLMYTATWPKEVRKIAADLLVNPVQVNIGNADELVANKSITQYVEVLSFMEKRRRVEEILRSQEPGSKIIIFCATKKMCDQLAGNLNRTFGAAAIHGDKNQADRDFVLSQFRSGRSPVLVATDVAARGLDVKDIRVVVNFDFPTGIEDYVHRIGRTGRAGATGVAYTFFTDKDGKYASDLIKILEGASQRVPDELRDFASRGGGGGMGRPSRQWSSGGGNYDSGYGGGGNGGSGYGGGNGGSGYGGGNGGSGYGGGGNGRHQDSGYGGGRDTGSGGWSMSSSAGKGRGDDHDESNDRYGQNSSRDDDGPSGGGSSGLSFHERMMMQSAAKKPRVVSPNRNEGSGW